MDKKELINILKKDPKRNISALGFFERHPLQKVYRRGDSIIAVEKGDSPWAYISSSNKDELEALMKEYEFETFSFASVESWMVPIVAGERGIEWVFDTHRYLLPRNVPIGRPGVETISLDRSWAAYIHTLSNYGQQAPVAYIAERLEREISAGVFVEKRLVAWCLTHDDGALGILYVLPEYRRRAFAEAVAKKLIHKKRENGQPVFANIKPDNIPSIKLVTKLGFVYDRNVSWLKLTLSQCVDVYQKSHGQRDHLP